MPEELKGRKTAQLIGGGRAKKAFLEYSRAFSGPRIKGVYLAGARMFQRSIQSESRWESGKKAVTIGVFPSRRGKIPAAFVSMRPARFQLFWVWFLLFGTAERRHKSGKSVGRVVGDDFWSRGVRRVRPTARRFVIAGLTRIARIAAQDIRAKTPPLF